MTAPAPAVTVYIVNHNYGRFIEQAVASVLRQTMQDFEVIIIDDGSTDNSREIIAQWDGNPRISIVLQHNRGLNIANNIAIRMAHGRYIMRLDADDFLEDHALQVMSGILDRAPDVGLVFPDYYHVDEAGEVIEMVRRHEFEKVTMLDQPAHGACTMIRRDCLLALEGYDESFQCQDGWDLWIRFIQHYGVRNINLPLFFYRRHGSNLTRNEERLLDTRAAIMAKHSAQLENRLTAAAIIPVRGRATDPHSIALETLGSKTVLDWTLDTALGSERLSAILVTTPDEEILDHIRSRRDNRLIPILRDRRLAAPNTHIEATISSALEAHSGPLPEALVALYIDCPFRRASHIDSALDVLTLFDTDTVIAVRPETDVIYRHNGNGLNPLNAVNELRLEREELFRQVAKMHVVRREFFERTRQIVGGRTGHVVVDRTATIVLQSDFDWRIAEFQASQIEAGHKLHQRGAVSHVQGS
jgi:CMP-N-acetylneuraminic acid synthetase